LGNKAGIASTLNNIGGIHYARGNYEEAITYYKQSLVIARELGDEDNVASNLNNLGTVYKAEGNNSRALDYYKQSLEIGRRLGDRRLIATLIFSEEKQAVEAL